MLHDGDGDRPHPLFGRLPVHGQPAGRGVDQDAAALRRAPGEIAERQRQAPAQALMSKPLSRSAGEGLLREGDMKAISFTAGIGLTAALAMPASAQLLNHKDLSLATALTI